MTPNPICEPFSGDFSNFSAILHPISPVRPESSFQPFFADFGSEARNQSVASQRDCNSRMMMRICKANADLSMCNKKSYQSTAGS